MHFGILLGYDVLHHSHLLLELPQLPGLLVATSQTQLHSCNPLCKFQGAKCFSKRINIRVDVDDHECLGVPT
ncbi:hypothetical protein Mapa_016346 [Marchantia paleacea]|nr:hypothetical protein Mapa_016346 [Marchantia paleacea]